MSAHYDAHNFSIPTPEFFCVTIHIWYNARVTHPNTAHSNQSPSLSEGRLPAIPATQPNHEQTPLMFRAPLIRCESRADLDSQKIAEAKSDAEQFAAIDKADKIHPYVWKLARSSKAQLFMLERLQGNPDHEESIESFKRNLIATLRNDANKSHVEIAIRSAYKNRTAPFSDFVVHEKDQLFREIGKTYSSLAVCNEENPFIQLELIRRAERLDPFCFEKISTSIGQLHALGKFPPRSELDPEVLKRELLEGSNSDAVQKEINRRWRAKEAPFSSERTAGKPKSVLV